MTISQLNLTHTHTHKHTHIYIYIYIHIYNNLVKDHGSFFLTSFFVTAIKKLPKALSIISIDHLRGNIFMDMVRFCIV